jgi:RNA 2',3'-cyclic 3'-phosphodiesterase
VRLFLAIELTDAAREAIAAEQARLKHEIATHNRSRLAAMNSMKWVKPEHMHVTLAFLGEVADERSRLLVEAMRPPLETGRFSITFGGLGVFPSRGRPRVLWLGVSHGSEGVLAVQQEVVTRIAKLDIVTEDRSFHPHLTLARWRDVKFANRRWVTAVGCSSDLGHVDVESVSLVHSKLAPAGPTYTALWRTPLRADAGIPLQSP